MAALGTHLDKLAGLLEHYSGIKCSGQDLLDAAASTLAVEREFNRRAGLGPAHDRLPEFMTEEPLPVINSVFDVADEDLKRVYE